MSRPPSAGDPGKEKQEEKGKGTAHGFGGSGFAEQGIQRHADEKLGITGESRLGQSPFFAGLGAAGVPGWLAAAVSNLRSRATATPLEK